METIKLKLSEILKLDGELNGISQKNNQTGEVINVSKGFLSEKLPLSTKYWLLDLDKQISDVKKTVDILYDELIKKYGVEDNGSIIIPLYIESTVIKDENGNVISGEHNPNFTKFQDEYNSLLNEEREVNYHPIPLSIMDKIETEQVYHLILKNIVFTESE
jgi:hypothetical protein